MYRTRPEDIPELKIIDLTPSRIAVIIGTVFIFFVIPVSVITYFQHRPVQVQTTTNASSNSSGKVAGISTQSNSMNIPFTNITVDLNSEGGVILTVGFILVGLSIILIIFLIIDNIRFKKYNHK